MVLSLHPEGFPALSEGTRHTGRVTLNKRVLDPRNVISHVCRGPVLESGQLAVHQEGPAWDLLDLGQREGTSLFMRLAH